MSNMHQDDIHAFLKTKMVAAGYLAADQEETPGWSWVHQAAWESYAYHKLATSDYRNVPNNEIVLALLFPEAAPESGGTGDAGTEEVAVATEPPATEPPAPPAPPVEPPVAAPAPAVAPVTEVQGTVEVQGTSGYEEEQTSVSTDKDI